MRGSKTADANHRLQGTWLAALCACGALLAGAAYADDHGRHDRDRSEHRDHRGDDRRGGGEHHDRRDGDRRDWNHHDRDHRDGDRRGRDWDRDDHNRHDWDRRDWNRRDSDRRDWNGRFWNRDLDRRDWHGRDWNRRQDWWRDARYVTYRPDWHYYNGRYWAPPVYRGRYCTDPRHYHGAHYHVAASDYYEYYYPRYRYYGASPISASANVIISIPLF